MMAARSVKLRGRVLLVTALAVIAIVAEAGLCRAHARSSRAAQGPGGAAQAERFVAEGLTALERDDFAAARGLFEMALDLDPKNAAAHTNLGILADGAGDLEAAAGHFAAAARLAPSATTHNNFGVILVRLGRTREAAAEFEASLRADARQPSALVNLAQIRFSGGTSADLREAADLLARAFSLAPDAEIARARTVLALRREDRTAAAARYGEYSSQLTREGTSPAGSADARTELGGALLEAGLLREAEAELSAAVALAPANAEAAVLLARVYLKRDEIPSAGRTLEAAVARGIDSAPVYALLAEVYERSGHLENAIPAMRLAIQRDPQSEKYRFGYGMLLMNAYAPAAAVLRLEEALKVFPDSPRLWFALGLAHFKHDRDEESVRALNRALELDPKFAPASAYLGMVRAKTGAYEEAVALYESALRTDPNLAVVHYLIAEALAKQAEADAPRIESHLRRVVKADPSFVPAHLALARLMMRGERWTEAAAELERTVALDPSATEAYYHLGRVYARLKRADDARTALATFERLSATQKEQEHGELQDVVRRLANVNF